MPEFVKVSGARNRFQGIDSKESILPAYVAWRAGTSNKVVVLVVLARQAGNRFLASLKSLQIRAQYTERQKQRGRGKGVGCSRAAVSQGFVEKGPFRYILG